MELLREQIEEDSDIEQDSFLFQVHKCDQPVIKQAGIKTFERSSPRSFKKTHI